MFPCCNFRQAISCLPKKTGFLWLLLAFSVGFPTTTTASTSLARNQMTLTGILSICLSYSASNFLSFNKPSTNPNGGNIPDWVIAGVQQWGGGWSSCRGVSDDSTNLVDTSHTNQSGTNGSPGHSKKTGNDDEDANPPPDDETGIPDTDQELQAFDRLLEEFGELLKIAEKKKMFVVLETDLDDSLVQDPEENLIFPGSTAQDLEQQRFYKFSCFLQKYSGLIVLVYNTARPALNSVSTPEDQYREVGLARTGYFPNSHSKGLAFKSLNPGHQKTILPVPDYLIVQLGTKIEEHDINSPSLTPGLGIRYLNAIIQAWKTKDKPHLCRFIKKMSEDRDLIASFYKGHSAARVLTKKIFNLSYVENMLKQLQDEISDFQVTLTPLLYDEDRDSFKRGEGSLASVNKGAAFRLLLDYIVKQRNQGQDGITATPLVFVFGDSGADMSMLRPDLEISAMGSISQPALHIRNQRYINAGVDPDDASWWQQSVYPSGSLLDRQLCGATVSAALKHPKVTRASGWGVASFLKTVISSLRQHFANEQDNDIPLPAGNF